jgi:multiple sugar transport system ATP-binding protein
MIYVTHDQIEAMTLADRIAIMKDGVIQQLATPAEIYNTPENLYVADFIGSPSMNLLKGRIEGGSFLAGDLSVPLTGYNFTTENNGDAWFGIRPEHVVVGDGAATSSVSLDARAEVVEALGSDTLVMIHVAGERFWLRIDGQSNVKRGDTLRIGISAADASLFDVDTERRL